MEELGELLRSLRGKKSLRDIAEITGLSHSYIADVEKGYKHDTKTHVTPSPDTLKKLSIAYNYDYEELMYRAGHLSAEDRLGFIYGRREEKQNKIEEYAKMLSALSKKNNINIDDPESQKLFGEAFDLAVAIVMRDIKNK